MTSPWHQCIISKLPIKIRKGIPTSCLQRGNTKPCFKRPRVERRSLRVPLPATFPLVWFRQALTVGTAGGLGWDKCFSMLSQFWKSLTYHQEIIFSNTEREKMKLANKYCFRSESWSRETSTLATRWLSLLYSACNTPLAGRLKTHSWVDET